MTPAVCRFALTPGGLGWHHRRARPVSQHVGDIYPQLRERQLDQHPGIGGATFPISLVFALAPTTRVARAKPDTEITPALATAPTRSAALKNGNSIPAIDTARAKPGDIFPVKPKSVPHGANP